MLAAPCIDCVSFVLLPPCKRRRFDVLVLEALSLSLPSRGCFPLLGSSANPDGLPGGAQMPI